MQSEPSLVERAREAGERVRRRMEESTSPEVTKEADEQRPSLGALLRTWTDFMSGLSDYYSPRLENLPEDPPLDELAKYQWVVNFHDLCVFVERLIDAEDFGGIVGPWVDRVEAGEQVPPDIHTMVRDFQSAWTRLLVDVRFKASDWIMQQRERIGEAATEFSDAVVHSVPEQERLDSRWSL